MCLSLEELNPLKPVFKCLFFHSSHVQLLSASKHEYKLLYPKTRHQTFKKYITVIHKKPYFFCLFFGRDTKVLVSYFVTLASEYLVIRPDEAMPGMAFISKWQYCLT